MVIIVKYVNTIIHSWLDIIIFKWLTKNKIKMMNIN
jgi:hypothetical protein